MSGKEIEESFRRFQKTHPEYADYNVGPDMSDCLTDNSVIELTNKINQRFPYDLEKLIIENVRAKT